MSLLDVSSFVPPPEGPPPPDGPAPSVVGQGIEGPPARQLSPVRQVASTAILILSLSLLGFAGYLGFASRLHFDRAQHDAYANFRSDLAQATAPVGPTQPADAHALLTPGTAVAVLNIPQLRLRDVVFEGTSGAVLQDGPGHLRDTVLPGQSGYSEILGRAATYGGPFGQLAQLHPGDTFTVTTGQAVSTFRVIDIRHGGDPQPAPPAVGKGRLILITASGPPFLPSGVLRVDADLISPTQPTPAPVLTAATLPTAEQPLHGDLTALFPLVLWGQGLVLAAGLITWALGRWGRWQVWIVAVPVLGFFGLTVADQVSRLLFNLM
ncbi:MAG TPA: sortase [Pseudonocardiaceae bacterium]